MSGEIILQRVLHPDPYGEKMANFEYARGQYKQRLVERGLANSPIIEVALQVAEHYQERLLDEPRWVKFDLGTHGTDMNVGSHQYRQTMLADISAQFDHVPTLERELVNAASIDHDLGEIGIIEETGEKVSDVPKPIKMKDPRKYELGETKAALKMIQDAGLEPQEAEALMEVYWRLITSTITPDEYQQMSGPKIGAWPGSLNWSAAKDGFELSEFYGYKLTAVQQLQQLNRPVNLTAEEAFRATNWTDQDMIRMMENPDPKAQQSFFLNEDMRRLFVYKCGWVKQIIEGCELGRPSARYFAQVFYQEMQNGRQRLNLGIDLDQVCPGFEELGQALKGQK